MGASQSDVPRADPPMTRLDELLPRFDISERHWTVVESDPVTAFDAARGVNLDRSLPAKVLFGARSVPHLLTGKGMLRRNLDLRAFEEYGFNVLAEERPRELVLGIVGRFWKPTGGVERIPPEDFVGFDRPGFAKGAMNLLVEPAGSSVVVSTETRVLCLGEGARRSFGRYWRLISPFSGYLRGVLLGEIKRAAEAGA